MKRILLALLLLLSSLAFGEPRKTDEYEVTRDNRSSLPLEFVLQFVRDSGDDRMLSIRIKVSSKQDSLRQGYAGWLTLYDGHRNVGHMSLLPVGSRYQEFYHFDLDSRFIENTTFEFVNGPTKTLDTSHYSMKLGDVLEEFKDSSPKSPPLSRRVKIAARKYLARKLGRAFDRFDIDLVSHRFSEPLEIGAMATSRKPHFALRYRLRDPQHPFVVASLSVVVSTNARLVSGFVPDCAARLSECEFPIDEERALEIARQRGLPPGLKPWTSLFDLDLDCHSFVWRVTSVLKDQPGSGGYVAEELVIDANSGEVCNRYQFTHS